MRRAAATWALRAASVVSLAMSSMIAATSPTAEQAQSACAAKHWPPCSEPLDLAYALDPDGENLPETQRVRDQADTGMMAKPHPWPKQALATVPRARGARVSWAMGVRMEAHGGIPCPSWVSVWDGMASPMWLNARAHGDPYGHPWRPIRAPMVAHRHAHGDPYACPWSLIRTPMQLVGTPMETHTRAHRASYGHPCGSQARPCGSSTRACGSSARPCGSSAPPGRPTGRAMESPTPWPEAHGYAHEQPASLPQGRVLGASCAAPDR